MTKCLMGIAYFVSMVCVCLMVNWACENNLPPSTNQGQLSGKESLYKGQPLRPDLQPIGFGTGHSRWTGDYILVTGSHDAIISCVDSNAGTATFVPVDSLNEQFIMITTALLDTVNGTLTYVSNYCKDDFGATIPVGGMDVYDEEYDSLQFGYLVNKVEYNANGLYDMPRQNKVLYFGFYFLQNAEGFSYARFDNKFITRQVENQFRQLMK